jgi:tetratricopeptide (TPR) repeat protein
MMMLLFVVFWLNSFGQMRRVYKTIETEGVLFYKVEEIVNMAFGGTNVKYTVSDLSLISKVDLGPNNIRIITPIYKNKNNVKKNYYVETKSTSEEIENNREPTRLEAISIESGKIEISETTSIDERALAVVLSRIIKLDEVSTIKKESQVLKGAVPVSQIVRVEKDTISDTTSNSNVVIAETPKEKVEYIYVNVVYVYERVLEKGYRSVFMLKAVANHYYFKNQMDKAAKWYAELFEMTNDLEPIYYYRFGDSLKSTGKNQQANAMIEKFNLLVD